MPLILIAMFAAAAVSTHAQTSYGVRGNVPFDFIVGDKTIPAGPISVQGVRGADQGPLAITNLTKSKQAVRNGRKVLGAYPTGQAKMVFHKYGNRYFLAEVWIPGYHAWEIMKSKEERSLERDMRLVKNFKPERVIVAGSLD